jgi:hypothetical protein
VVANGIAPHPSEVEILAHEVTEHGVIGKVEALHYDRLGDFVGSSLRATNGAIRRLDSHERGIADLVKMAWEHRHLVRVVVDSDRPDSPATIEPIHRVAAGRKLAAQSRAAFAAHALMSLARSRPRASAPPGKVMRLGIHAYARSCRGSAAPIEPPAPPWPKA